MLFSRVESPELLAGVCFSHAAACTPPHTWREWQVLSCESGVTNVSLTKSKLITHSLAYNNKSKSSTTAYFLLQRQRQQQLGTQAESKATAAQGSYPCCCPHACMDHACFLQHALLLAARPASGRRGGSRGAGGAVHRAVPGGGGVFQERGGAEAWLRWRAGTFKGGTWDMPVINISLD